jgi:hypothetical protein
MKIGHAPQNINPERQRISPSKKFRILPLDEYIPGPGRGRTKALYCSLSLAAPTCRTEVLTKAEAPEA